MGWWNQSDKGRKARVRDLLYEDENVVEGCIRLALNSNSNLTIVPLQDILGLDSDCRMNTPGTSSNNWNWQFSWDDLIESRMKWYGVL